MDETNYPPQDAAPPPPRQPAGAYPPQPNFPYGPEPPGAIEQNSEAKTWGMACHLSSLAGYVIPFGNIIGPMVCWLVKKDEYGFVDDQGKESLNFQLTMTIILVGVIAVGLVTMCIYVGIFIVAVGVPAVGIFDLVMAVIAAIKANSGEYYRYPVNIRIIN